MKPCILHSAQTVPCALEEVFPFFEQPSNLEALTPPHLSMTILTPQPVPMHSGTVIDYQIRVHGIPARWTTLIAEYDPPHRFVDVQLRGPYSFWHHTHTFTPTATGTLLRDEVHYMLPFGPLGSLAHALWVRRDLERIFQFRRRKIIELFGADPESKP